MIHLGQTAKYLRERKSLSQRETAEKLEISQVHLSHIENNRAIPSPALLDRYKRLWGVDLYVLAWCLHGDADDLPDEVRKPMHALAAAWKKQLGDVLEAPPSKKN